MLNKAALPGVGHLGPQSVGAERAGPVGAAPADREALRVVPFPPDYLGQDPATGVDEPVTHLEEEGGRWRIGREKIIYCS